ncbi:hypothetical protein pb186bvf_009476 [Paramecium bursaria]
MELQKSQIILEPLKAINNGHRYIIQKNLNQLIPMVLKEATEFQSSNQLKLKSLQQLKWICYIADVQEHLTQIFKVLAKLLYSDDKYFEKEIKQICFVIGNRIQSDFYLPTLISLAQLEEQTASRTLANILILISESIQHETDNLELQPLIHLIIQVENQNGENFEIMDALFQLSSRIIQISQNNLTIYARQIFQIILSVKSFSNLPQGYAQQIETVLKQLAFRCGYSSVTDLHSNEVNLLLDHICQGQQFKTWKSHSREFNKFKAIIQGCGEGVAKFMDQIIMIMAYCLHPDQEMDIRIEVLLLLDNMVQIKQIQETIRMYSSLIFNQLIIPSMIWKIGKPNAKIRKASVIIAIYLADFLKVQEVIQLFTSLSAPLKSCLNDDWAPDLRFAAARLTTKLIQICPDLEFEQIREFYPALLERLDDSQNPIRIEICSAIKYLFASPHLKTSTIAEYIIKAVLIHLDDSSEDVQKAVFQTLQCAVPRDIMIREAEISVKNFKYPRYCLELIKMYK